MIVHLETIMPTASESARSILEKDSTMVSSYRWTAQDIPNLAGHTVVVTGTGGLGFVDALELARAGASVILAGRNPQKGAEAITQIVAQVPSADVRFEQLDLASLESVERFAMRVQNLHDKLDLLINNAGVMVPPKREQTADGFELQMGTNYLGHFALTAHLMPMLQRAIDPRVVTVSSIAARRGRIDFDDLQAEQNYKPMQVYAQSKLACLMFAIELQRRSDALRWGLASIAAHPGVSRTDLLYNAPGRWSPPGIARSMLWFLFQPPQQGALPTLFAATSPDATPGEYYGPANFNELRGAPAMARVPVAADDPLVAGKLWVESEELTNAKFPN